MKRKIVLIGAGSAVFSISMIKDICLTPQLIGSEVSLVDIDEKKLETAYRLCTRYAKELGVELSITKHTDRLEALVDADYVVNTALACNHQRMQEGMCIAKKYGYRYGGSLHIMHDEGFWINFYQFRLIEDVYLDVRKIAPNAWYILLSNPVVAAITMLGRKYHDDKIVGLCEGPTSVHKLFSQLGMDETEVSYELSGCNHFVWITKLEYKGQDAFPMVDKWIEENGDNPHKTVGNLCPKALDMYRCFGALPIGDTHSWGGGSFGWWYHTDAETERNFSEDPDGGWERYFEKCAKTVKDVEIYAADTSIRLTEIYKPIHSDEVIIDLIEALDGGKEKKIAVNIMNDKNYVPGVPSDFNVEVLALCSQNGIKPMHTDGLNGALKGHLLADRVGMVEVELQAYLDRSKTLLVDLIMMDHQTKDRNTAQALVEEILNLPWNTEMKEYYQ